MIKAAADNSVRFVARIDYNERIFADIRCPKIKDLATLNEIVISYAGK